MINELELDTAVLSAVLNNKEFIDTVDTAVLEKESIKILSDFKEYVSDVQSNPSLKDFALWFINCKNVGLSKEELTYFKSIFNKINRTPVEEMSVVIDGLRKQKLWKQLVEIKTKSFNVDNMREIISKFASVDNSEEEYLDGNLSKAMELLKQDKGLKWRIESLNKIVGDLYKGVFVLAAAYQNGGKSAFAVSEACHMATQLSDDQSVLYFNNEEHDSRIIYRLYQSILETPLSKILSNPKDSIKKYESKLGRLDKIKVFNVRGKSLDYIIKQCKKHNPGLIILDQIDNISYNAESHRAYNELYARVRDLANTYAPVIGLTQAAGTAKYWDQEEGREKFVEWLGSGQLHHSRVDKQGTTDVLLMIGRSNNDDTIRNFSVERNKMSGREGKFRVKFNGTLMSMTDAGVNNLNEVF